jgi:hypothetical protein
MYWSVIGLYGAFMAETFVRLPKIVIESGVPFTMFYNVTGIAVAIAMGLVTYFYIKLKPSWDKTFEIKIPTHQQHLKNHSSLSVRNISLRTKREFTPKEANPPD